MKKENIIIGAIAIIGLLTLFNTYKIVTSDEGRTISPANPAAVQTTNNSGANFPNTLPQQNPGSQPQPITQGMPDIPKTGINFATPKKDFGKVSSTSSNSHTFVFTNTGTEPLVISNAKGSCGCTVPQWPREPIAPGKTGVIKVKYDTKRVGIIGKSVTIQSNATNEPTKTIRIKGNVKAAPQGGAPVNNSGAPVAK